MYYKKYSDIHFYLFHNLVVKIKRNEYLDYFVTRRDRQ